ncbi:MAG TPA: hypothetical protein VE842_07295 [Pyrinomonadaceae bacterium]|nr:hypothetical protein [Pyrinomonadaceae bacterium]
MKPLMATTHTTMTTINVVIALSIKRRHFSLRFRFLSAFSFPSMTRAPSLQLSLFGATLTSGVPSARQNASRSSA